MTAALATAAVLGMCFGPTRWLGIAATALLAFDRPWLSVVVIIATGALLYVLKLRK
jgi:hypothetical protein